MASISAETSAPAATINEISAPPLTEASAPTGCPGDLPQEHSDTLEAGSTAVSPEPPAPYSAAAPAPPLSAADVPAPKPRRQRKSRSTAHS
jgi:hypothetical protein